MYPPALPLPRGLFALLLCACTALLPFNSTAATSASDVDLCPGWRFHKGDLPGAEQPGFDDHAWRGVDLPHDWGIESPEGSAPGVGPQDKDCPGGSSVGYLRGGTGWYRRSFVVDPKQGSKAVDIIFDGVQQESDVWLNGHHLGFQPHGYIGFHYDLTPYLKAPGETNVIAVRAVNPELNSRWYPGSGLYRQVSLHFHEPLHIPVWGLHIDTVWISKGKALLQLKASLRNLLPTQEQIALSLELRSPKGDVQSFDLGQLGLPPDGAEEISQKLTVDSAQPWSPDSPNLYVAELKLSKAGQVVDSVKQNFGIRTVSYSADKGLQINGETVKLKGGCMHHDNGLLGAATFSDAEFRRVALMKANGFNAIRTSHNPPSSAFLDACDRLGMLVIDEFVDMWELPKPVNGYNRYFAKHWEKDLRGMLARDFNHPSVVVWSIGNEIQERAMPSGVEISRRLVSCIRSVDARRPVTNAICGFYDDPDQEGHWERSAPAFTHLDIGGYNYMWKEYENDHAKFPARIIVGTESFPREAYENWRAVEKNSYVIGDFVWTGMDHLGESGIGHVTLAADDKSDTPPAEWSQMPWPTWINWSGDIDIIGNKKPQSFYRDVVWDRSPVEIEVHTPIPEGKHEVVGLWGWPDELPSWTWTGSEKKTLSVNVYSKAKSVRLELNGRLVGEKAIDPEKGITANFQVPYEPGLLKATALADGRTVGTRVLETTGPVTALTLMSETTAASSGIDRLLYLPVELRDARGHVVPNAVRELEITVEGPARLQAFGSASPTVGGSLQDNKTESFRGRALAILRPTGQPGKVVITLKSPSLPDAKVELTLQ